jgi:putative component of membrane protein insertase Oxa1/YidC/SpoIIIJ protein YidD
MATRKQGDLHYRIYPYSPMDDETKNEDEAEEFEDEDFAVHEEYAHRRKKGSRLLLYVVIFIIIENLIIPPRYQASNNIALGIIWVYQSTASKALSSSGVVKCRFYPSCSEYGRLSLRHDGFIVGLAKGTWRVLRCNPSNREGLEDWPYDGAWDDTDKLPQRYLHLHDDLHLPDWAIEDGYYIDKGKLRKAGDEISPDN